MDKKQSTKLYLVSEYLKKYPTIFSKHEIEYILACAKGDDLYFEMVPDLIREVYDELGILAEEKNMYLGFIEMADEIFCLKDRCVLEVGGGILPRLGERISSMQEKGSVIVYDPRLSEHKEDSDKLKLVRKKFNSSVNVSGIDLMLGLMPCKAAETIVDVSAKNNIDFMVALCEGGPHGEGYDFYEDDEEWRASLISHTSRLVSENGMGKLKIKHMKEYGNPYPVIYNERLR